MIGRRLRHIVLACGFAGSVTAYAARPAAQGFSFRTNVELVNVSATVTDNRGRFVSGLKREDFTVIENGQPQTITQFDAERVPVSLGILLDTSGSMLGDKMTEARRALQRFLVDLLGPDDEVFLYTFDADATLVRSWTTERRALSAALGSIKPFGGTAMYDAVAEAVPLAEHGRHRKKAIVVISDGNDTDSRTRVAELQQRVRASEVLVYAIGIDTDGAAPDTRRGGGSRTRPSPSPFPGAMQPPASPTASRGTPGSEARVNAQALQALTDNSGGRTEIITRPEDLDPATARIADELSRQYFLGYVSSQPRDGAWHSIDVKVRRPGYVVRARRGFIAG